MVSTNNDKCGAIIYELPKLFPKTTQKEYHPKKASVLWFRQNLSKTEGHKPTQLLNEIV